MSTALAMMPGSGLSITENRRSVQQMVAQREAIVEAMKTLMKEGVDYGTIPGTPKPTLYKPGSEKILSMFNLAVTPTVEDVSTPDTIRYRLHVAVSHAPSSTFMGTGVGEASSAESKYQWRAVVCDEEWHDTPEDRRRVKWKKGYQGGAASSVRQIRADMEDVANTILKMAKKRAQIDAVLTVTAASDVFAQDLKDLIDAGFDTGDGDNSTDKPQEKRPEDLQKKQATQTTQTQQASNGGAVITEGEGKRWWAVAIGHHKDYSILMSYLRDTIGITKKDQIPAARYKEAMAWAEGKTI